MEQADVEDLKSSEGTLVRVQIPPPVPEKSLIKLFIQSTGRMDTQIKNPLFFCLPHSKTKDS